MGRFLVGTIYSRALHSLDETGGKTTECSGRRRRRRHTSASTSPQKAITVLYIFLYQKKPKTRPALKQISTVVSVQIILVLLFV